MAQVPSMQRSPLLQSPSPSQVADKTVSGAASMQAPDTHNELALPILVAQSWSFQHSVQEAVRPATKPMVTATTKVRGRQKPAMLSLPADKQKKSAVRRRHTSRAPQAFRVRHVGLNICFLDTPAPRHIPETPLCAGSSAEGALSAPNASAASVFGWRLFMGFLRRGVRLAAGPPRETTGCGADTKDVCTAACVHADDAVRRACSEHCFASKHDPRGGERRAKLPSSRSR